MFFVYWYLIFGAFILWWYFHRTKVKARPLIPTMIFSAVFIITWIPLVIWFVIEALKGQNDDR